MRWLCRVNNVPPIIIEHFALFVGKSTLRVIQNKPGAQWGKGGIDMNWIGITRKIHCMYAMPRKMPPDPFNAFKIGCKPMLHHQILAKTQHISSIKQWFFFGCDEEFFRCPLQPLFHANFFRQIIRVIISIGQPWFWRRLMPELRVIFPVFLQQRPVT